MSKTRYSTFPSAALVEAAGQQAILHLELQHTTTAIIIIVIKPSGAGFDCSNCFDLREILAAIILAINSVLLFYTIMFQNRRRLLKATYQGTSERVTNPFFDLLMNQ